VFTAFSITRLPLAPKKNLGRVEFSMLTVFAIVATLVIVTLLSTDEERHEEFWGVIGRGFKAVISGVKSVGRRGGSAGKLAAKGSDDALAAGGKPGNIVAQGADDAASVVKPAADVAAQGSRNMLSPGLRWVEGGVKGVGKSIKKNPWEFLSVALTIPFLAAMFSPVGSQEEGDAEGGNGPGPNQIMSLLSVVSSSCFCFFCASMLIAASSASSASSA